ncbi:uncharacterized protein LOC130275594 isoform X5 [Hyla sarda]|uniref:uncharacterized protein LOC130275594 isoform X5 n=1 Tax=Hyla sarda TaxID=327740 RepID=UPI0024C2340A|nr:uncharacterized protein LOC130275594 isoform X5 [Hyla sarda]
MRTAHAPETRHVTTDGRMARLTRRVPASSNKEPASRQTEAFGEDDQDITARRPMMNMNNENSGHEDSGEIRRSHIMVLQGKGVTSLVLTLLNLFLHGLLSILQKYRYLIWVSLNILIVGGFMYYYFDDNASCLSDRESLKIQLDNFVHREMVIQMGYGNTKLYQIIWIVRAHFRLFLINY